MAKKGSRRFQDWMAEYAFFVTLACVIAVIVSSAVYTQRVREQTQERLVQAAAGAPEILETAMPKAKNVPTPLPTIAPLQVRVSVLEERMVWPVEGAVLRGHDAQEMIIWPSLGAWQVHQGIDIAAEAGQEVRCAAAGEVIAVTRDALWGGSVFVLGENGRQIVYRGLAQCCVVPGQQAARGDTLGVLMEKIPCEAELGAHLHLETQRDGAAQDPLAMLPEK